MTDATGDFRWGDIDERLLSPKTNDLAEEMQKRIAIGERTAALDTDRSGNTAGYLTRLFDFHEQLTNEWAERLYAAHREAWAQQNQSVSAAFIRAVRDHAITQLIAVRKSSVHAAVLLRGTQIGEQPNPIALGEWNRRMDRLAVRWSRRLEAEAVASEYQKSSHVDDDRRFELMAIEEARKSVPEDDKVRPKVGAVVVKNGKVLATAYRGEAAGNHAEYFALDNKLADDSAAGATVYTTLEPCTARNPPKIPCVERIIARKIKRVVIGMVDPDVKVRGLGLLKLRDANISIQFFQSDLMDQIEEMNRDFIKDRQSKAAHTGTDTTRDSVDVEPNDPRIYVDVLDRRGGFAGDAPPATVFRFRNGGGTVAHKIQLRPITSSLGEAVFEKVDSIAVGENREVLPKIERAGIFQKNDIADLLMKQWNAAGELTEEHAVPCSVTYEDYSGKLKFESTFDLVYFPIHDISRRNRVAKGKRRPNDRDLLQVRNVEFKRLSNTISLLPPKPKVFDLPPARPVIVPKRYGPGILKNDIGYTGLAVVNDGEPAYDLTISGVPIEGGRFAVHHGHTERLTKGDGESFYPCFIDMRLGGTSFGSGLFDFMRERHIPALTVPITYRDADNRWFQTDIAITRDVEKPGGLRLGWSQKQISDPASAAG